MTQELQPHEISRTFTMLDAKHLMELAQDIKLNGQVHPGLLFEGQILDGRNRYEACKIAGVKFEATEFTGTSLEALARVRSLNKNRRHQTSSQAAASDASLAKLETRYAAMLGELKAEKAKRTNADPKTGKFKSTTQQKQGEKPSVQRIVPTVKKDTTKLTDHHRAQEAGTNREYIKQADVLVEKAPELIQDVIDGKKSIPEATREYKNRNAGKRTPEEERKIVRSKTLKALEAGMRGIDDLNDVAKNPKLHIDCINLTQQVLKLVRGWKV